MTAHDTATTMRVGQDDELRRAFRRKAHTAAMERCLTDLLRCDPSRSEQSLASVRLRELPEGRLTEALLRRRAILGLSTNLYALSSSTPTASRTRRTRSRSPCGGRGPPASRSTATHTSVVGC